MLFPCVLNLLLISIYLLLLQFLNCKYSHNLLDWFFACLLPCGLLAHYRTSLSFVWSSGLLTCFLPCLRSISCFGCFLSFVLDKIFALFSCAFMLPLLQHLCDWVLAFLLSYWLVFLLVACFLASLFHAFFRHGPSLNSFLTRLHSCNQLASFFAFLVAHSF